MNTNILTSKQQEFIKSVITYVQQNGDITFEDLVEKLPFSEADVSKIFEYNIAILQAVVKELHSSIVS